MYAFSGVPGFRTLFVREDGVQASWSIVDPVLGNVTPLYEYEPNTWGPTEGRPDHCR